MKEIVITQVVDGYIVRVSDQQRGQEISVTPNLGRAIKKARQLFGEDVDAVAETVGTPFVETAPSVVKAVKKAA